MKKNKIIKKSALITGGSGYIGSCLAASLYEKYHVFTLDKNPKNIFLNKKIKHIKCDLNNKIKLKKIIKSINPSTIIHLAAQSTIDMIEKNRNKYFLNNLVATKKLIKITKDLNINKFIFASTASVYNEDLLPLSENSVLKPNNLYGSTKLINEKSIIKNFKKSKTKYCILRFFNVVSALKKKRLGEFHSPETHLVPVVINSLFNNKKIIVYGKNYSTKDGTCLRDYIHIKDIIIGIIKSIDHLDKNKSNIFNLGSGRTCSVLDVINTCSKITNIKPKILIEKKRKYDCKSLICKIDKAKKYLKWKPINSNLIKIIKDELRWFKYLKKKKFRRKFIY